MIINNTLIFNKKNMQKKELIDYLNEYLKISEFKDISKNWLQIDSEKIEINKIGYSVDSSTYIFDKAKENNVDMILSHHWVFWWFEQVLVWIPYIRAKKMIENNICLYAAHLPLDAHGEVGNNIWMIKEFIKIFDLKEWEYEIEKFWEYKWNKIWFWIKFSKKIKKSDIIDIFATKIWIEKNLYNFWNKEFINSIAFVSGWALSSLAEAKEENYDLFVSWEWNHNDYILAKELGQSILVWGHYETEVFWVKLLAEHLKEKFWIEIVFLDEKY